MNDFCLSRDQVRELDRRAIHEFGIPGVVLMENAGRGAAELLWSINAERQPILVCCGPGNNGGDGFVIARHLQNLGGQVEVLLFGDVDRLPADAQINAHIWSKCGPLRSAKSSAALEGDIRRIIDQAQGWIVDALFGTGLTRPLGMPFDQVIAAINGCERPILAVDIPSGLDCDTGEPLGPTIRATHTATFVAHKKAFANPRAKAWLGEVRVLDIGAPKKLIDEYRVSRS